MLVGDTPLGPLLIPAVIGAAGTVAAAWFASRNGRRWRGEDRTDSAVGNRLAAIEDRSDKAAEWRGQHGMATDEWVGQTELRMTAVEAAIVELRKAVARLEQQFRRRP